MIILSMSANAFVDDEFVCLQSSMDGFMHKPVVPNVFYATLLY
jgi:CheY-like chemotaxis protein